MQRHRPSLRHTARSQRGGMALTMMLVMLGLVLMLGLVEIGYLYWAKRDAQKTADLAALAGAQRLGDCNPGNTDNSAARYNAEKANAFPGTLDIRCGVWDAANTGASDHFTATVPPGSAPNAVKVVASRSVIPFFGINESLPTVSAQAIAKRSSPMAVFSVGSQLARLNGNTPLGNTLRVAGLDVNDTTLMDYNGLAGVHITPGGLLKALGIPVESNLTVAGLNKKLVDVSDLTLGRLLSVTATLVGQDGLAKARVEALAAQLAAHANLENLKVKLGSDGSNGGVFAHINAPDGNADSALSADIDVLDLLNTAISVATSNNAVSVDKLNVLGQGVQVEARVVEPASIGIGGVGTTAYNAQVRVRAAVDTNGIPLLGLVTSALGIRLNLPVYADATTAFGEITEFQCGTPVPKVKIKVTSNVLRTCVGNVPEALRFSKINVCEADLGDETMLTLLGATLVRDQIRIPVLEVNGDQDPGLMVTLAAGETASTQVNKLRIGDTVKALVNELLRVLSNVLSPRGGALSTTAAADQIADHYLRATNPGNGLYDVDRTIKLLREGDKANNVGPLGDWDIPEGIPVACGLLGAFTCFEKGSVWESFKSTVSNTNRGLLDGLVGGLLGGVAVERCSSLLSALLEYNSCVKRNLASYIRKAPKEIMDAAGGTGVITDPTANFDSCTGLLCNVLKPVIQVLAPLLNSVGQVVSSILTNILGIELGRTDVHVQSIQCSTAQLVY